MPTARGHDLLLLQLHADSNPEMIEFNTLLTHNQTAALGVILPHSGVMSERCALQALSAVNETHCDVNLYCGGGGGGGRRWTDV